MVTRHVCKTSVLTMLTQNKHFDVNLQCIYFSFSGFVIKYKVCFEKVFPPHSEHYCHSVNPTFNHQEMVISV